MTDIETIGTTAVNIPEQPPSAPDIVQPAQGTPSPLITKYLSRVAIIAQPREGDIEIFAGLSEAAAAGYSDLIREKLALVAHWTTTKSWQEARNPANRIPEQPHLPPYDPEADTPKSVALYVFRLAYLARRSRLHERLEPTARSAVWLRNHDARVGEMQDRTRRQLDLKEDRQREFQLDRLGALACLMGLLVKTDV